MRLVVQRRRPRGDPELSQEVSYLIGRANLSYVTQDFDAATAGFEEVLRIEPTVRAAWNALAKMADERGEWEKGLKLEMIAAHLTPSPAEAWKALAVKSRRVSIISRKKEPLLMRIHNEETTVCSAKPSTASTRPSAPTDRT